MSPCRKQIIVTIKKKGYVNIYIFILLCPFQHKKNSCKSLDDMAVPDEKTDNHKA